MTSHSPEPPHEAVYHWLGTTLPVTPRVSILLKQFITAATQIQSPSRHLAELAPWIDLCLSFCSEIDPNTIQSDNLPNFCREWLRSRHYNITSKMITAIDKLAEELLRQRQIIPVN